MRRSCWCNCRSGLNLPVGAKLQVDDGKVIDLQIQTCEARGCYASTPIAPDLLAAMKSGKQLKLSFQNMAKETITIPMPLADFARRLRQDQVIALRSLAAYCRAISALPTPSPSSFWSSCMATVTRSNRPVNSNGAS